MLIGVFYYSALFDDVNLAREFIDNHFQIAFSVCISGNIKCLQVL